MLKGEECNFKVSSGAYRRVKKEDFSKVAHLLCNNETWEQAAVILSDAEQEDPQSFWFVTGENICTILIVSLLFY
jgi:hypothetical protein